MVRHIRLFLVRSGHDKVLFVGCSFISTMARPHYLPVPSEINGMYRFRQDCQWLHLVFHLGHSPPLSCTGHGAGTLTRIWLSARLPLKNAFLTTVVKAMDCFSSSTTQ